jgi:hypothetical protein
MQTRATVALYAMVGPKRLRAVRDPDGLEGLGPGVGRCKGNVPARAPVLREGHLPKYPGQPIDERNDGVAPGDRQRAAWHEVVLQVDEEKYVARARLVTIAHRILKGRLDAARPPEAARVRR